MVAVLKTACRVQCWPIHYQTLLSTATRTATVLSVSYARQLVKKIAMIYRVYKNNI
jgi:hypothetical protein